MFSTRTYLATSTKMLSVRPVQGSLPVHGLPRPVHWANPLYAVLKVSDIKKRASCRSPVFFAESCFYTVVKCRSVLFFIDLNNIGQRGETLFDRTLLALGIQPQFIDRRPAQGLFERLLIGVHTVAGLRRVPQV